MNSKESMEAAGVEILPAEVEPNALTAITKGEVDIQVVTAKRYPRSIARSMKDAETLATVTKETAESCFFALPRGKGAKRKNIEGPSIRLAEIMASSWGNLRCEARIVEEGAQDVTAQATAWDMQTNVLIRVEAKRRIADRDGKRYSLDMILMTQNAAISIALRNAIFRVVPRSVVDQIYKTARRVAFGDAKTMIQRRSDALYTFSKMGVTEDRVLAVIGRDNADDITAKDMSTLLGLLNAIRAEETTVDDAFPEVQVVDATSEKPEQEQESKTPAQEKIDKNLERARAMGALDPDPPADGELPLADRKVDKRKKPIDENQIEKLYSAIKGVKPSATPDDVVAYCERVVKGKLDSIESLYASDFDDIMAQVENDKDVPK